MSKSFLIIDSSDERGHMYLAEKNRSLNVLYPSLNNGYFGILICSDFLHPVVIDSDSQRLSWVRILAPSFLNWICSCCHWTAKFWFYGFWDILPTCLSLKKMSKTVLPDGLFSYQKSQFGFILEGLRMGNVCLFYNHLNILRPLGVFYCCLVQFVVIWYILPVWYVPN
jgi:hypothetical protein